MGNKVRAWSSWIGVTICSGLCAVAYGGPTLFYDTILQNTGCNSTQFGLIFSAIGIGLLIGSMLAGKALEVNSKLFSCLGALGIIVLYSTIYFSRSIYLIIASGFIFGFLFQFCNNILLNIVVTKWFETGRSKLVTMGFIGQNVMTAVCNPLIAKAVVGMGGSFAALVLGIAFSGVCLLLMLFAVSRFPDYYGMKPIRIGKDKEKKTGKEEADDYESKMPAGRIATTPVFICLVIGVFFISAGSNIYSTNSTMIFQSFGLSYEQAVYAMSLVSIFAMGTNFLCGMLLDSLGPRFTISIYTVLCGLVYISCPLLHGWSGAIIFALLTNCCAVANFIGISTFPKLFGKEKSSVLFGWLNAVTCAGSIIIPPVASGLYGWSGNYVVPMIVAGAGMFLAVIFTNIALSPKTIAKVRRKDAEYAAKNL